MRCLVLAVVSLCGLMSVACDGSDESGTGSPTVETETRTPTTAPSPSPTSISNLLPDERDPHAVVASLRAQHPELADIVGAVERGDLESVIALMPFQLENCDQVLTREGDVCSLYDLEPGVETRWIQPGESFGSVPVGHRRDELKAELRGRPASLELIALQDGVRYYLIFALDPRDPPPVALTVVYEPGVAEPVTTADFSGAFGGPPLEFIRFDHYHGVHQYEVLAAAESFHEREKRWAEERARMNTAPPPDHN